MSRVRPKHSHTVSVFAQCRRCGSVIVDDGVSLKIVPSYAWLRKHADYIVPGPLLPIYMCDACIQGRRTDYCSCGSGKKVAKCSCGSRSPYYELGSRPPEVVWL